VLFTNLLKEGFRVQGSMINPVLGQLPLLKNLEPVGKGRVYVYSVKYP
jgi:hypothetical protein